MRTNPFTTMLVRPTAAVPIAGSAGERALVLGGGGSTGNAWLIGIVAGLHAGGLDVTRADLLIGTSAGSTAAAQITTATTADLLARTLDSPLAGLPGGRQPNPSADPSATRSAGAVSDHLARTAKLIAAADRPADARRRLAEAALVLESSSDPSRHALWRATVAARLPDQRWPDQRVWIVAVDAHTGTPVVLDQDSGVDLADAIAASCASGVPHRIGDKGYLDGGYRRNENADLAAGYARVLVLSPSAAGPGIRWPGACS